MIHVSTASYLINVSNGQTSSQFTGTADCNVTFYNDSIIYKTKCPTSIL